MICFAHIYGFTAVPSNLRFVHRPTLSCPLPNLQDLYQNLLWSVAEPLSVPDPTKPHSFYSRSPSASIFMTPINALCSNEDPNDAEIHRRSLLPIFYPQSSATDDITLLRSDAQVPCSVLLCSAPITKSYVRFLRFSLAPSEKPVFFIRKAHHIVRLVRRKTFLFR